MATDATGDAGPAPGRPTFWSKALDIFYTLWVLRVLVAGVVLGTLLLMVPQSEDLFVQLATGSWFRIFEFFFLLFFVWAATTHYGARILVTSDARYAQWLADRSDHHRECLLRWSPRVLGALPFVAVGGSIFWSWWNLPEVQDRAFTRHVTIWLAVLELMTIVALVLYWIYVVRRKDIAASPVATRAEQRATRLIGPLRSYVPSIEPTTAAAAAGRSDLGPLLLIFLFVIFTIGAFIWPLQFAEAFPRAAAVPFIVGGWLPLLVYFSGIGRRVRVPFILLGFLFTSTVTFFVGDNFTVRQVDPAERVRTIMGRSPPSPELVTRLSLNDAITMWQSANGCAGNPAACPRPIVIAASGGASRAGFFTASVIGQMLDRELKVGNQNYGDLNADAVRNRIFAISSVSGSSVGAVMAVAAMGAAPPNQQPCRSQRGSAPLWQGDPKPIESWRSCFEALISGDFLTPVLTGFVFRDMLRFLHWSDRAALLERSWERQFAWLIDKSTTPASGLACTRSLECPFLTLRPNMVGADVKWLPLLVINGTSVGTGQRIMTSVLDAQYRPADGRFCPLTPRQPGLCQIFAEAYDFYGQIATNSDVRLSTGADNSARFPIVSPPGEIRGPNRRIVDRIVDGGYFENSGAQSAFDLLAAMRTVEPKLAPFILILSNDPEMPQPVDGGPTQSVIQRDKQGSFLTDISAPIKAILHSRDGRAILAVDDVRAALDRALPSCAVNSAHIRVWAEPDRRNKKKARPLSMSWWLSKPVQLYMHEQTLFDGDKPMVGHGNREDIANMVKGLNKEPGCIGPG